MARGWKFWIWKVEELYYLCGENKGTDQLGFTYADCLFSHEAALICSKDALAATNAQSVLIYFVSTCL